MPGSRTAVGLDLASGSAVVGEGGAAGVVEGAAEDVAEEELVDELVDDLVGVATLELELLLELEVATGMGGAGTWWVAAHPTVPAPARSRPADATTATVRPRRPPACSVVILISGWS
ncbi:hypothetical protein [Janibacter sp. Soil728]|uniref:hypothetical protein n=1 Tax=Janibacter sp. Soil728 TaxID=1736393 RepID=UPI000AAF6847|nr:hypothetical protein [Janibacter sp. Soil728]